MSTRENPFAGLRPYDVEENYLFFGREKAVDELLLRLGRDNFLAVLGRSGSGKSSVVRAGLIPALEAGQLRRAGPRWRVAIMRPGGDPFGHLADSLVGEELLGTKLVAAQSRAMVLSRLRRGSRGLHDLMGMSDLRPKENLLILVDQFEELFRFAQDQRDGVVDDEAAAFVQLLLDAAESPTDRLYVAITMRSDFLGDCSRYRGLAEALSQFMYLVPRMTRSERRAAIAGPIAIERARAEPRLVSRLLNEADDAPDQLPVLQHALRQTWEAAAKDVEAGKPLDSKHYVAAGGIAGALDQHAEAALAELDEEGKTLARCVFQTITELGPDNRGVRRPTRLGTIAEITGSSIDEVLAVLEPFRREGRGFVMPRVREVPEPTADTVIDISHEALMRAWSTLKDWVRDEAESVAIYRRLATTAAQFPDDPDWLYPDPALTAALDWRESHQPRPEWGRRHEPNFEQALAFLDRSRDHRDAAAALAAAEAEQKLAAAQALAEAEANKALLAKRNVRITRGFLGIALLLLIFAGWAWAQAREKEREAVAAQKEAMGNLRVADAAKRGAEAARGKAEVARSEAEEALEQARASQEAEALALMDAQESAEAAVLAAGQAEAAAADARTARGAAELALAKAEVRRVTAELRRSTDARPQLMASALASVAAMDDDSDPELVIVMRSLLQTFGGPTTPLPGRSRVATVAPSGRWAAFGSDGLGASIVTPGNPADPTLVGGHDAVVSSVVWGPSGDRVAVADDRGHVTVWSAGSGAQVGAVRHPSAVRRVAFDPAGKLLVTTGDDGSAKLWDLGTGQEIATLVGHDRPVFQAEFRPVGEPLLATAGDDGNVCLWSGPSLSEELCFPAHTSWVHALAFSRSGRRLASAGDDGVIRVVSGTDAAATPDLLRDALSIAGHEGPVTSVNWGPTEDQLLSGSFDRSARLWDLTSGRPVEEAVFSGHQDWVWMARGVWSGPNLIRVVTAGADGLVRLFDPRGHVLREFAGDGKAIRSLDIDSDGRWLAWGGETAGWMVDLESSVGTNLPSSLDGLIGVGCRWLSPERSRHPEVDALWAEMDGGATCGA